MMMKEEMRGNEMCKEGERGVPGAAVGYRRRLRNVAAGPIVVAGGRRRRRRRRNGQVGWAVLVVARAAQPRPVPDLCSVVTRSWGCNQRLLYPAHCTGLSYPVEVA